LRTRHYSRRTEEAYIAWIRRYIFFHGKRHPAELGGPEVTPFLSSLAVESRVAASIQNQALSALLFLYRDVPAVDLPWLDGIVRARRSQRLPVVLARDEVRAVIQRLEGAPRLMACLLSGAGLRVLGPTRAGGAGGAARWAGRSTCAWRGRPTATPIRGPRAGTSG
jgi:integrase